MINGPFKNQKTSDRDDEILLVEVSDVNKRQLFLTGIHMVSRRLVFLSDRLKEESINLQKLLIHLEFCESELRTWADSVPKSSPPQSTDFDRRLISVVRQGSHDIVDQLGQVLMVIETDAESGLIGLRVLDAADDLWIDLPSLREALKR